MIRYGELKSRQIRRRVYYPDIRFSAVVSPPLLSIGMKPRMKQKPA